MNIEVDLNKVEAYRPEGYKDLFQIPNSDIHIKMRMPTMKDIIALEEKGVSLTEAANLKWSHLETLIASCVESVIEGTAEDSTVNDSFTMQELIDWFEGVPDTVLEDIIDSYLSKMPYLRYSVNMTCVSCGTEHKFDITGIENFFG